MERIGRKLQEVRETLGESVRTARLVSGISQKELAVKAGLNRVFISDVERGTRNVSLDSIARIADALDLELCDLFIAQPGRAVHEIQKLSRGHRKSSLV